MTNTGARAPLATVLIVAGALVAVAGLALTVLFGLSASNSTTSPLVLSGGVPPEPPANAVAPPGAAIPSAGGGEPQAAYRDWAARLAAKADLPARAAVAYAAAHAAIKREQPSCQLGWSTLAGIARVESNHGRFAGAVLNQDGRTSQPVVGIPLDGRPGVKAIRDTDGGALDGDRTWDRAVGPFQFIPSTWARWAADGDGNGVADPHDLDDAALAAARYLCAGDRDLATGTGWWKAVLSYNASVEYGWRVFSNAEQYVAATR